MKPFYYLTITFGCQMSESDAEHFGGQLEQLGGIRVDSFEEADIIVMNTCCVRESAEKKIFGKIGELKKWKMDNPERVLCVSGCLAEKDGEKLLKRAPHIDLVVGTQQLPVFASLLQSFLTDRQKRAFTGSMAETDGEACLDQASRRSAVTAWIPIMYGCNNFCTYCIVPYVRGREKSRPEAEVLAEVRQAVQSDYKEIYLLGQNVNSYGKDRGEQQAFADLLAAVDAVEGVERVRFMTSHPRDMTEAVLQVIAASKHISRQIHLPVQSGSSSVLKRMNRGYSREDYLKLVQKIRTYLPTATLTTDIIVGFPGETEAEFSDTLALLREVGFDMSYIFLYSKRSGTPAASLENQIPLDEKKRRFQQLNTLQSEISLQKNLPLVGTCLEVLVEGPSKNDSSVLTGRTDGNKLVLWPDTKRHKTGDLVQIKITKAQTWLLKGQEADDDGKSNLHADDRTVSER